ncbi:MAG: A/G-specific adenine glycosylase [bacterium]|nr:A/G-specific adenine glycosylase [bacterium]
MMSTAVGHQRTIAERQRALMRWYRVHGRHRLSWRRRITPDGVLVSEVMLQQTQVDRVIPYWNVWMRRWPTMEALARAKRAGVIRAWAGLGYNRRAVNLHRSAQEMASVPATRKLFAYSTKGGQAYEKAKEVSMWARELQRLPGVGPYTANALLAFAWNFPAPCVDTNVRRVLAYVIYRRPSLMRMPMRRVMEFAARVIPPGRGREWNYALMDYGALVFRASAVPKRNRPVARQGVFKNSARFWRGRIVAVLRDASRPLTIVRLHRALASHGDVPRVLHPLLTALQRDGVIVRRRQCYALA